LRRLLLASALLCALCVSAALGAQRSQAASKSSARAVRAAHEAAVTYLGTRLQQWEERTWHWQRITGRAPTETAGRTLSAMSIPDIEGTIERWQKRARVAHKVAQHPPHLRQWMCIHHYEGAWNDVGAPYWGGLQMSLGFQERYGSWLYKTKGTADHWTPLEQMWTAENALKSRGFFPWPNTAKICGLI
jgi:hypothetical protein